MNKYLNTGLKFLVLAFAAISLLSATYFLTKAKIAEQKLKIKAEKFLEISPNSNFSAEFFNNPQKIKINNKDALLYKNSEDFFIELATSKGYSGEIVVLIGLKGEIIKGVRILEHKETAGLGDKIELEKSPWILSFNNQSLKTKNFAIKKDGGDFDSFSGATITPRAVVNLLKEVLTNEKAGIQNEKGN